MGRVGTLISSGRKRAAKDVQIIAALSVLPLDRPLGAGICAEALNPILAKGYGRCQKQ
jgi:hypothetical protein